MAPFVVSNPYTANKPNGFNVNLNGQSFANQVPDVLGDGSVRVKFDLAGRYILGLNQMTISAVNVWGESSATPFEFTAETSPAPSGIKLEL